MSDRFLHQAEGETKTTYVYQLLRNGETWVDMFEPTEDYAEVLHMGIYHGQNIRLVRRTTTNEVIPS